MTGTEQRMELIALRAQVGELTYWLGLMGSIACGFAMDAGIRIAELEAAVAKAELAAVQLARTQAGL